MKGIFVISIFFLFNLIMFGENNQSEELAMQEKQLTDHAQEWMSKLFKGDSENTYNPTGKKFKTEMTSEKWKKTVKSLSGNLKLVSRNMVSKEFAKSIPENPDGDYYVIKYKSSFQVTQLLIFKSTKEADESVIFELEDDGNWYIISYSIDIK